jgi:enoyl-CoA hydratase
MAYDFERITVDVRDGIALCTLNRPEKLNAIDEPMWRDLTALGSALDTDDDVRVGIITGAGRGFCAGADLGAIAQLGGVDTPQFMQAQERAGRALVALKRAAKPLVAAVNGPATGGGLAIALAADVRIAAPEARFNVAFVRLGLSGADVGVSWMLPRVVGMGHASELMLTGRLIDADEALRIGLVNRVVPAEELIDNAFAVAAEIASNSPFGLRLTKQALHVNVDAGSMESAVEVENRNQVLASRTQDMTEAITAFLQKRPPDFKNR